ncbi:hypothetical protein C8R46DRAFT_1125722 [Mycena filopes]|nr:hypothetical protein C8R46DRAFT_1125722 [Mycena filopes]
MIPIDLLLHRRASVSAARSPQYTSSSRAEGSPSRSAPSPSTSYASTPRQSFQRPSPSAVWTSPQSPRDIVSPYPYPYPYPAIARAPPDTPSPRSTTTTAPTANEYLADSFRARRTRQLSSATRAETSIQPAGPLGLGGEDEVLRFLARV